MPSITVRTEVHATEDPEKVRKAIVRLFPDVEFLEEGQELVARGTDLTTFKDIIRKMRILDTTRSQLIRGRGEGETSLNINKQVAYVGKVSFIEEETPLGVLRVSISSEDVSALIDEIAPKTFEGEEV
jgi:predicted RNA binding protein with dsRBD fold (UPF0201 family)